MLRYTNSTRTLRKEQFMAMPESKKIYLEKIRDETAYPIFRRIIQIFSWLIIGFGILCIISSCIAFLIFIIKGDGVPAIMSLVGGVLIGIIYITLGRLLKELASVLADIADSVTEMNSRPSMTTSVGQPAFISTENKPIVSESSTRTQTLSEQDQEIRADDLMHDAKVHLASGAKDLAIDTLREIIRLYTATRAADKARASLKRH